MIAGRPISLERRARLVDACVAMRLRGHSRPMRSIAVAEQLAVLGLVDRLGVGADQLDAVLLPACRSRRSASAVLSAVWPPMVGSSASGRSFSMILATISGVIGSM